MGTVFARDGDLRMRAIEAVEVVDVIKLVDPTAKTQEVVGVGDSNVIGVWFLRK